jgi:hypothetical protein
VLYCSCDSLRIRSGALGIAANTFCAKRIQVPSKSSIVVPYHSLRYIYRNDLPGWEIVHSANTWKVFAEGNVTPMQLGNVMKMMGMEAPEEQLKAMIG